MSNVTVYLEMMNDSVQQMASAICKHYKEINETDIEANIELKELASHILAYVNAENEKIEYYMKRGDR